MAVELNHTVVPGVYASMNGRRSTYAAAKAGIALLTGHRRPGGRVRVRVNCITPETILTEGDQDRIPAELQASPADAHPLNGSARRMTSRPPPHSSPPTGPPGSPA